MQHLTDPVVLGPVIGIVIALLALIKTWFSRRAMTRENASLLRNHVFIHDTATTSMRTELEKLRQQNENLRISVASLRNKPEQAELRMLYVYDHAIKVMVSRSPGFAPVWESVVAEAELTVRQVDTGVIAWIRRSIRPTSLGASQGSLSAVRTPDVRQ